MSCLESAFKMCISLFFLKKTKVKFGNMSNIKVK